MAHLSARTALLGLGLALTLSGCGGLNPAGLAAASRLDPLDTQPSDIALAVGVPATLRLSDGDAILRMAFREDGAAGAVLVDETVPLQLRRVEDGAPKPRSEAEIVYAARFGPEAAARIATAQDEIKAFRAAGVDGQGSLSIAVTGGCVLEPMPSGMPVRTWLQTAPEAAFVPLVTTRLELDYALCPRP